MPRPTKSELFDQVRTYLDTDELNFPDPLLDMMCQRVWFQAVALEREWRFFQRTGSTLVGAGQMAPMSFTVGTSQMDATRIYTLYWNGRKLAWTEYTTAGRYGDSGDPVAWSEFNDGTQRLIALFPSPSSDGTLVCDFYAEPVYPLNGTDSFGDLPEEFDAALREGLLGEMYNREEDPDLGDMHAQMFMQQMGSIRDRWRRSIDVPIVLGGRAVASQRPSTGFRDDGRYTQATAP